MAWLWLYGPPGVGKSTTGFALFEQLAGSGHRVAFIELDQIGMCMPSPAAVRSAAKADNLLGLLDNFSAAGAHGVIVSGDIGETMTELLERAPERPVLCRLRADDAVAIERLIVRGSAHYAMASTEYESFDVPVGDIDVTTHPLEADEVAAEIMRRLGAWPPASPVAERPAPPVPSAIGGVSGILVVGPRAVGTSTVAWRVLMESVGSGHRTAFLDIEQLCFLAPALQEASLATKLANIAWCWSHFRRQGAERLVLSGHSEGPELSGLRVLMPSIRVVALTAAFETLLERAGRRRRQKDIWLPGDDLFGRDDPYLRDVVRQASTYEPAHADLVIGTDNMTPADAAARIAPLWPGTRT